MQEAGNYEAPQYWKNRTEIGKRMEDLLDLWLKQAHARCEGLQLLTIGLPDSYEESIVDTQVEVQKTNMKEFEQKAAVIEQERDILLAERSYNISMIEAKAHADAFLTLELYKAEAERRTLEVEADMYSKAMQDLELTQQQFNEYLKLKVLGSHTNATVLIGLQQAPLLLNINSS